MDSGAGRQGITSRRSVGDFTLCSAWTGDPPQIEELPEGLFWRLRISFPAWLRRAAAEALAPDLPHFPEGRLWRAKLVLGDGIGRREPGFSECRIRGSGTNSTGIRPRAGKLLQPGVFRPGPLEYRDIGVRVFPQGEEILVGSL
jgi:hypothetical protein